MDSVTRGRIIADMPPESREAALAAMRPADRAVALQVAEAAVHAHGLEEATSAAERAAVVAQLSSAQLAAALHAVHSDEARAEMIAELSMPDRALVLSASTEAQRASVVGALAHMSGETRGATEAALDAASEARGLASEIGECGDATVAAARISSLPANVAARVVASLPASLREEVEGAMDGDALREMRNHMRHQDAHVDERVDSSALPAGFATAGPNMKVKMISQMGAAEAAKAISTIGSEKERVEVLLGLGVEERAALLASASRYTRDDCLRALQVFDPEEHTMTMLGVEQADVDIHRATELAGLSPADAANELRTIPADEAARVLAAMPAAPQGRVAATMSGAEREVLFRSMSERERRAAVVATKAAQDAVKLSRASPAQRAKVRTKVCAGGGCPSSLSILRRRSHGQRCVSASFRSDVPDVRHRVFKLA